MPGTNLHTEEALLENLRNGSEEAFEEIFKRYWHAMYKMARSKVQSHEDAEEIVQQIFSALWEKRHNVLITNLSFYFNTAIKNRVINNIRQKITQQKYCEYYKAYIPQNEVVTDETVEFDDLTCAVEDAVQKLPEKSRQVFKLSRIEGRSTAEIAKLLQLSEKAIEYHITKSLKQLKIHLKDFIFILLFIAN